MVASVPPPVARRETETLFQPIDAEAIVEALQPPVEFDAEPPVRAIRSAVPVVTRVACPVCSTRRAVPRYDVVGTPFRLLVCEDCGLGRVDPLPSPQQLDALYAADYYGADGRKFGRSTEWLVQRCAKHRAKQLTLGLPRAARVLDVGCGRGVLLGPLADMGCEAHGFEISPTAARGLDPRVQLHVGSELGDAALPSAAFDLIVLWHVLEHLTDPAGTLAEAHRLLKPGGRLAVAVPNFASLQSRLTGPAWFHLDLPRHLFHFNPPTLTSLLERCGFQTERASHLSLRQNPFGWVQSVLNRCGLGRRNELYRVLKHGSHDVGAMRRSGLKFAYLAGMPFAAALSALAAMLRTGGTICVTARSTVELG